MSHPIWTLLHRLSLTLIQDIETFLMAACYSNMASSTEKKKKKSCTRKNLVTDVFKVLIQITITRRVTDAFVSTGKKILSICCIFIKNYQLPHLVFVILYISLLGKINRKIMKYTVFFSNKHSKSICPKEEFRIECINI